MGRGDINGQVISCTFLSDNGFKLAKIASIFNICRQTAATWLHAWKDDGICALFDKPRSGRPPILCKEAEADAITRVNQSPRSLKKVLAELTASLNLTVTPSISTLKRICGKNAHQNVTFLYNTDSYKAPRQLVKFFIGYFFTKG